MTNKYSEEVHKQLAEWEGVFGELKGCTLEWVMKDRFLIKSHKPVMWENQLKPQYGESKCKIGYIMPKKTCIGLYIDFPVDSYSIEELREAIDPDNILHYAMVGKSLPRGQSWWRKRTSEGFDSLHMVIHKDFLTNYTLNLPKMKQLLKEITDKK